MSINLTIKRKSQSLKRRSLTKRKSQLQSHLHSQSQLQSQSHLQSQSQNDHKKDKKFTYLIGDYGNNDFIFVTFTSKTVFVHKNINYPHNKKTYKEEPPVDLNNLEKSLQFGKWESKEYKYISAYMSDVNNPDMNGHETTYNNFKDYNSCTYMLIKLHDNHYLSLGYRNGRFTFTTPNNDNIKYVNWGKGISKSGNLNAYLVGEKYTYNIFDSGSDFEYHFYISNNDIKKYDLKENPHTIKIGVDDYDHLKTVKTVKPVKPYIIRHIKKTKKMLGLIKYNMLEKSKIYDVIHLLEHKNIDL